MKNKLEKFTRDEIIKGLWKAELINDAVKGAYEDLDKSTLIYGILDEPKEEQIRIYECIVKKKK